jgi:hypothetical protein
MEYKRSTGLQFKDPAECRPRKDPATFHGFEGLYLGRRVISKTGILNPADQMATGNSAAR